jgi:hypothetical protein
LVANSRASFTGTGVGVKGLGGDGLLSIGVYGEVGPNEDGFVGTGIGGYFNGGGGVVGTAYSVQLLDGTEGINKVLVSQTADGKANWSSVLTGLTSVSATTINATNLYVTGGTQSIFSGNSSSDLVRITQTGSGDAFVVEDSANSDSSHFVIDAVGNVAIGLTTPRQKLDVSGNTIVSGTISGGTMVITTLPTSGYTTTQILMRNSTSGQVEITDSTSPSIYNYGMSYAMSTFNYLT